MIFPVKLYLNDGTDSTLIYHQTLPNMIFASEVKSHIDSIVIDPELWVLKKIETISKSITDPVLIYPNPTRDAITIKSNNSIPYDVIITDIDGKQVLNSEFSQPNVTIDLSTFAAGN